MKLRTSSFCGISRTKDWQAWLKQVAPDLLKDLVETLKIAGCRKSKSKMISIYRDLYSRNLGPKLESFIEERFPHLIDNKLSKSELAKSTVVGTTKVQADNVVFKNYRPDMLTFPHRLILTSEDPATLEIKVKKFVIDKYGVDYIIIGDRAYIEYFDKRYAKVVDQIDPDKRELAIYRRKNS